MPLLLFFPQVSAKGRKQCKQVDVGNLRCLEM